MGNEIVDVDVDDECVQPLKKQKRLFETFYRPWLRLQIQGAASKLLRIQGAQRLQSSRADQHRAIEYTTKRVASDPWTIFWATIHVSQVNSVESVPKFEYNIKRKYKHDFESDQCILSKTKPFEIGINVKLVEQRLRSKPRKCRTNDARKCSTEICHLNQECDWDLAKMFEKTDVLSNFQDWLLSFSLPQPRSNGNANDSRFSQNSKLGVFCGATGCGKSWMISHCAEVLNYRIIEINAASFCRTGRRILESLQEISTTYQYIAATGSSEGCTERNILIVLEEVDEIQVDERGFWSAVVSVARDSKRPIVMTCNDRRSVEISLENTDGSFHLGTRYFHLPVLSSSQVSDILKRNYVLNSTQLHSEYRNYVGDLISASVNGDLRAASNLWQFWSRIPPRQPETLRWQSLVDFQTEIASSMIGREAEATTLFSLLESEMIFSPKEFDFENDERLCLAVLREISQVFQYQIESDLYRACTAVHEFLSQRATSESLCDQIQFLAQSKILKFDKSIRQSLVCPTTTMDVETEKRCVEARRRVLGEGISLSRVGNLNRRRSNLDTGPTSQRASTRTVSKFSSETKRSFINECLEPAKIFK
eukprot:CAMPEP_0182451442 /NCGR_PEP_ID=MMETSP1172-20130603/43719_1 /TAXON_ID=708627 /ORGANISM="Timspurckia oligopyrenoides, Strain CCMP3278" /LENGTH=593 /DNA_ID=CAMNT_0024649217 /DNA_START=1492 /DNA_END=3273 /DNA_ORIENTATION=+